MVIKKYIVGAEMNEIFIEKYFWTFWDNKNIRDLRGINISALIMIHSEMSTNEPELWSFLRIKFCKIYRICQIFW